jgi:hypothetical protein
MASTIILFDDQRHFLGQMVVENGTPSFALNDEGSALLLERMKEWNSSGIPVQREVVERTEKGMLATMMEERIQPHDARFVDALRQWFLGHGYHAIQIEDEVMVLWRKLVELPLEHGERFSLLYTICQAPVTELSDWSRAIQRALDAVGKVG